MRRLGDDERVWGLPVIGECNHAAEFVTYIALPKYYELAGLGWEWVRKYWGLLPALLPLVKAFAGRTAVGRQSVRPGRLARMAVCCVPYW